MNKEQDNKPISIQEEFRQFILRGNILELAIGIIIGAAFTEIVNSLVQDIINPILGFLTSGVNLTELYINLSGTAYDTLEAAEAAGAPVIKYGAFLDKVIYFLIVAVTVFFVIKQLNKLNRGKEVVKITPAKSN